MSLMRHTEFYALSHSLVCDALTFFDQHYGSGGSINHDPLSMRRLRIAPRRGIGCTYAISMLCRDFSPSIVVGPDERWKRHFMYCYGDKLPAFSDAFRVYTAYQLQCRPLVPGELYHNVAFIDQGHMLEEMTNDSSFITDLYINLYTIAKIVVVFQ